MPILKDIKKHFDKADKGKLFKRIVFALVIIVAVIVLSIHFTGG